MKIKVTYTELVVKEFEIPDMSKDDCEEIECGALVEPQNFLCHIYSAYPNVKESSWFMPAGRVAHIEIPDWDIDTNDFDEPVRFGGM